MPTVYYPPIVVEILSGKTREPLGGIDLTNYTVAISPLGPGFGPAGWGEALLCPVMRSPVPGYSWLRSATGLRAKLLEEAWFFGVGEETVSGC